MLNRAIFATSLVLLVLPETPIQASLAGSLQKVSISPDGEGAAVTIGFDGSFEYDAYGLESPERLVVDFFGVNKALPAAVVPGGVYPVARVRLAQLRSRAAPTARLIVDLDAPADTTFERVPDGLVVRFSARPERVPVEIRVERQPPARRPAPERTAPPAELVEARPAPPVPSIEADELAAEAVAEPVRPIVPDLEPASIVDPPGAETLEPVEVAKAIDEPQVPIASEPEPEPPAAGTPEPAEVAKMIDEPRVELVPEPEPESPAAGIPEPVAVAKAIDEPQAEIVPEQEPGPEPPPPATETAVLLMEAPSELMVAPPPPVSSTTPEVSATPPAPAPADPPQRRIAVPTPPTPPGPAPEADRPAAATRPPSASAGRAQGRFDGLAGESLQQYSGRRLGIASPPVRPEGRYVVLVFESSNRAEADAWRSRLMGSGEPAFLEIVLDPESGPRFRVLLGRFENRAAAEGAATRANRLRGARAVVQVKIRP